MLKNLVLGLLLILSGCGENTNPTEQGKNTITVGVSPDMPPFEFSQTTGSESKVVGFDIDLIKEVVQRMNCSIDIKSMEFNSLIPALKSRRVDMVISSISDTKERRKSVDFSTSYLSLRIAALTKEKYATFTQEDFTGKKVGVQLGTSHEQFMKNLVPDIRGLTVSSLGHLGELVQELSSGRVDIVVLDYDAGMEFVKLHNDCYLYAIPDSKVDYAIAFNKGSNLVAKVNNIIMELLKSGYIDSLKTKWLKGHSG